MSAPVISIDLYRVKAGAEEQFKDTLRRHAAVLRELELATDRPFEVFLGSEQEVAGPLFAEIFEWADSMTAGELASRFSHSWPTTTRHLMPRLIGRSSATS